MRIDLSLNVRFWTESFEILRSQMCDPANEKYIEWSDMNEAEMRVTLVRLGSVRPPHVSLTRGQLLLRWANKGELDGI